VLFRSPGTWTCARSMDSCHSGAVNAVVQCKGRLASAGDDGTIKLWSSISWTCEVTLHNMVEAGEDDETDSPNAVGVMSLEVWEDKLFSGGDDSVVRVWNTTNWTCEQLLRAHEDEVWSLRVTTEGCLVTGSVDGTIRVWRHPQGANNENSGGLISVVSSSSSGNSLTHSNSASNLSLFGSIATGDWECSQIVRSDGPVYSMCCLDGRVVSAGASNRISVWRSGAERVDDWAA